MKNENNRQHPEVGSGDYRAFVGPFEKYDLLAAHQFNLLTTLGLRDYHDLLDIGCGSLRAGRLFIPYLQPERYYGIEPEAWLVQEGINQELGQDIINLKKPHFSHDSNFTLSTFGKQFDFIIAQSIFSHTTQAQIKRCFAEAYTVMKQTSLFAATFVVGDTSYDGDTWVYPKLSYFRKEDMIAWVEEAGLHCEIIGWHHPADQTWMIIHHPTNAEFVHEWASTTHVEELHELRTRIKRLEIQLINNQNSYDYLRYHPYVKFGLAISSWLRRLNILR